MASLSSLIMSRVAVSTFARRSVTTSASLRPLPRQILPQRRNFSSQPIRDETDHMYGPMVSHEEHYRRAILRVVEQDTHDNRRMWMVGIVIISSAVGAYSWHNTLSPRDDGNVLLSDEVRHIADRMIREAEESGLPNPFPKDRDYYDIKNAWLDLWTYDGQGPLPEVRDERLKNLQSMKEQDLEVRKLYQPHPKELPKVSLSGRLRRQFVGEMLDVSFPEIGWEEMRPKRRRVRFHRGRWMKQET